MNTEIFTTLMWFAAFIIWTYVLGAYLVGVYEFKSWKWPFK